MAIYNFPATHKQNVDSTHHHLSSTADVNDKLVLNVAIPNPCCKEGGVVKDNGNNDGKDINGGGNNGYDKDGYDREGYDKDGYDRDGKDRDGKSKDINGGGNNGYDKDGYDKDGYDKDGYDREGYDKDGYDKDGYDREGYDKDGYDRDGKDRDGKSKDINGGGNNGYDKDGYNKDGYDKDGYDKDGYDKDGYDRDGKDKDGKSKDIGDGDTENNESIEGIFIAESHAADTENCGSLNAWKYRTDNGGHIGKPAWFTKDLLKQFLPELMNNKEIVNRTYTNDGKQYSAENYAITFECKEDVKCGNNINFTWGAPSHMWCNKAGEQGNAWMKCPQEFLSYKTSVCCPSFNWASHGDPVYSKNFFLTDKCPNLVLDLKGKELEDCAGKTIIAKLESPLAVLTHSKNIIDKNGKDTGINYHNDLKPHLNPDGTMKDCGNNQKCEEYAKMMDQLLWASDKEVKLKIPDNIGEKRSYSPSIGESQDEAFSYHNYDSDLI